jgi:hypothetical protein
MVRRRSAPSRTMRPRSNRILRDGASRLLRMRTVTVARMSVAKSGSKRYTGPGCRFAHPGYHSLSCPGLTGASSTLRRLLGAPDPNEGALEYWIARSSRAMTTGLKSKSGPEARRFAICFAWVPGRSGAPPGLEGYFLAFLVFLAFFAFFAFFAFLAIASSLS